MHEVFMPRIDPSMETGKIVEWLKNEGETVEKGEPIVTVEGEKTTFDIEAPASGVLRKILFPKESLVPVAQAIAIIAETDEALPELKPTAPTPPTREEAAEPKRIKISPLARRLAEEHGLDITALKGTGPGGRIVKEDVLKAVEAKKAILPTLEVARLIPLTGIRRTIAERLSYSHRIVPRAEIVVEADMEEALKLRRKFAEESKADLSITAMIVKAVAKALEEHPILNSTIEGSEIKVLKGIHVGVAVSIPDGLIVPVIRDANEKSVSEISSSIRALSDKARRGERLSLDELTGGTFTVTNLGALGVEIFTPLINPPQAAILGVGKIADKPVVINGNIAIKPMVSLSLVFDHRITDGVPAAQFLQSLKRLLGDPRSLLS